VTFRAYQGRELHLVMDNYAAHKTPEVRAWLEAHPGSASNFTPIRASWTNLVEVWFGIVERQPIRRGVFKPFTELNAKIRGFITGWNDRSHPFVWTKTAEQVRTNANQKKTSRRTARHCGSPRARSCFSVQLHLRCGAWNRCATESPSVTTGASVRRSPPRSRGRLHP
jgi:hypothetical protein